MNRWMLTAFVMAIALLQTYFLSALSASGVVVDLLLITLVYVGAFTELNRSTPIAAVAGIIVDAETSIFGLHTALFLLLMVWMLVLKRLGADFTARLGAVLTVGGVTAFMQLATLVVHWVALGEIYFSQELFNSWVLQALLNMGFALVLHRPLQLVVRGR